MSSIEFDKKIWEPIDIKSYQLVPEYKLLTGWFH